MIAALLLYALLMQADAAQPQSSAAPSPPSGWNTEPSGQAGEVFRYSQTQPDGSKSFIVELRQVCDCDPSNLTAQVGQALSTVPNASVQRNTAQICGSTAQHVLATGIAGGDRSNIEVWAMRKADALYVLQYTFKTSTPDSQAERTLLTHCP